MRHGRYFMQNKSLQSSLLLGQQCDNNFRTENVPCNHLDGDDNNTISRERRDMIAYNLNEVLTPQQQQSSGHLSFATRYNSREKRNNNSSNEFDYNNDGNDMPIHKKSTRKIEKKKEDGFARMTKSSSKYKAETGSNDIYSWSTSIEKEEKDNQQSTHKTRYTYQMSHRSTMKIKIKIYVYIVYFVNK